jgi:hypothetical protein
MMTTLAIIGIGAIAAGAVWLASQARAWLLRRSESQ